MKKRNLFCALLVVVLIIAATALSLSDYARIQRSGIFLMEQSDAYTVTENDVDTVVEFTLDWSNIEASVGQKIYEDGPYTITIHELQDDENGGYLIYLDARGEYNYNGGRLLTPFPRVNADGTKRQTLPIGHADGCGYLETIVGEHTYISEVIYVGAQSVYPDGDCVGYSIFPLECYMHGELLPAEEIAENGGLVTVRLCGLKEVIWERVK